MDFETILQQLGSKHVDLQRKWRDHRGKEVKLYRIIERFEAMDIIIQFAIAFLLTSGSNNRVTVVTSHPIWMLENVFVDCRRLLKFSCKHVYGHRQFENGNILRFVEEDDEGEYDRHLHETVIILGTNKILTTTCAVNFPVIAVALFKDDYSLLEQTFETKTQLEKSAFPWGNNTVFRDLENNYALEESFNNIQLQ